MALEMSRLANSMEGFIDECFYTSADGERLTIVRFTDRESQTRWAQQPDHREAQRRGRDEFYSWYDISVAEEAYGHSFDGVDAR